MRGLNDHKSLVSTCWRGRLREVEDWTLYSVTGKVSVSGDTDMGSEEKHSCALGWSRVDPGVTAGRR